MAVDNISTELQSRSTAVCEDFMSSSNSLLDGCDDKREISYIQNALEEILEDPSFKTKSPVASAARQEAVILLDWCKMERNHGVLSQFMNRIIEDLSQCLAAFKGKKVGRDRLWRNFFSLRTSEKFINQWKTFLFTAKCSSTPVLYQHLVDLIFKRMINEQFEVTSQDQTDQSQASEVTLREASILRYVAGYICRHLRQKFEWENHPLKEELIINLMCMIKDSSDDSVGPCEDWIDLMDRGGLWHVRETVHSFFISLEQETQIQLKSPLFSKAMGKQRDKICSSLCESDDVQFYWLITTADFEVEDSEVHDILLQEIVKLFVTVRGFAFANAWMEKYKQAQKKSTQRSKSLRKQLYSNTEN